MKRAIWITSAVLTLMLTWVFWLTPVKVSNAPQFAYMEKSVKPDSTESPAQPMRIEPKTSLLDTAGKVSPLVSTGITVATFMRGRKRRKRHAAL